MTSIEQLLGLEVPAPSRGPSLGPEDTEPAPEPVANPALIARKTQYCVAAVVLRGNKVLVIRHRKRGTVDLPGGKKETETEVDALCRELYEECGLTGVRVLRWLFCDEGKGLDGRRYVVQVYLCAIPDDMEPVAGDDAAEAWWAEPEELLGGYFPQDYPHVKRLLDPSWKAPL